MKVFGQPFPNLTVYNLFLFLSEMQKTNATLLGAADEVHVDER